MNYPKMLYKGKGNYIDSAQIRDDLNNRTLVHIIVADEEQETLRRADGWVDLWSLMASRPVLTLPKTTTAAVEVTQETPRVKRKYTKRVPA